MYISATLFYFLSIIHLFVEFVGHPLPEDSGKLYEIKITVKYKTTEAIKIASIQEAKTLYVPHSVRTNNNVDGLSYSDNGHAVGKPEGPG